MEIRKGLSHDEEKTGEDEHSSSCKWITLGQRIQIQP